MNLNYDYFAYCVYIVISNIAELYLTHNVAKKHFQSYFRLYLIACQYIYESIHHILPKSGVIDFLMDYSLCFYH